MLKRWKIMYVWKITSLEEDSNSWDWEKLSVYKFSRQAKPSQAEPEHVTALPHLIYISYSQLIVWRWAKYLLPNHAYMRNLGVWPLDVHDRFPSWKKHHNHLDWNPVITVAVWIFVQCSFIEKSLGIWKRPFWKGLWGFSKILPLILTIIGPSYPYRGRQIQN